MFKKLSFMVLFLSFSFYLFPEFRIQVIYKGLYYHLVPYETKSYPVRNLYVSRIIDKEQLHRIRLDSISKSKLSSLLYVGDSYAFHDVRLSLISDRVYLIEDLTNHFQIRFSVADYDSVVLQSFLNFYNPRWQTWKDLSEVDYIASAIAVKVLLDQLSAPPARKNDLPMVISEPEMQGFGEEDPRGAETLRKFYQKSTRKDGYYLKQNLRPDEEALIREALDSFQYSFFNTLNEKKRIEAYAEFIAQLASYGTEEEIFKKVKEFVSINFRVIDDYDIVGDWVNPYDLLYEKKGDYKSIAFFYYYTFKQLGLATQAYFVVPLERRKAEDKRQYSQAEKRTTLLKHGIDPANNLDFRKYEFPDFKKSVLLVSLKQGEHWFYSTGKHWVFSDVTKSDRTVSHYSKNGCYYSILKDTQLIIENIPIPEHKLKWELFFDITSDPD